MRSMDDRSDCCVYRSVALASGASGLVFLSQLLFAQDVPGRQVDFAAEARSHPNGRPFVTC